jgi:hypothetical protein
MIYSIYLKQFSICCVLHDINTQIYTYTHTYIYTTCDWYSSENLDCGLLVYGII